LLYNIFNTFNTFLFRWYILLMPLCCFIVPTVVPYWVFHESLWCAWHVAVCRYCINLHLTWLVNSAAHMWGYKPYNKYVFILLKICKNFYYSYTVCPILTFESKYLEKYKRYEKMFKTKVVEFRERHKVVSLTLGGVVKVRIPWIF